MLNWIIIIIVIVLISLAVKIRGKEILKEAAYFGTIQAEKYLGSKTGQLKLQTAITIVREKLPPIVKWFVSEKVLINAIEDALKLVKKTLEKDGVNLLSLQEEILGK